MKSCPIVWTRAQPRLLLLLLLLKLIHALQDLRAKLLRGQANPTRHGLLLLRLLRLRVHLLLDLLRLLKLTHTHCGHIHTLGTAKLLLKVHATRRHASVRRHVRARAEHTALLMLRVLLKLIGLLAEHLLLLLLLVLLHSRWQSLSKALGLLLRGNAILLLLTVPPLWLGLRLSTHIHARFPLGRSPNRLELRLLGSHGGGG